MDEQVVAWERQRGETAKQFHAFCHHRDLGSDRSVVKAWIDHQTRCLHVQPAPRRRSPKRWEVWCARWGWPQRAELYDADLERQVRLKCAKELVDARSRHLRIVVAQLQVVAANSRVVLEALSDPTQIGRLVSDARSSSKRLLEHLDRAARNASATAQLVETERLILGMSTEIVELEDRRASLGSRIPENPQAVALAIQLLDSLAGTGPGTEPASRD